MNSNLKYYGSSEEDKYIQEYFPEGYVGTCIEVGGSDGVTHSNTYRFEQLGWECLVLEPQPGPRFFDSCEKLRKHAINCAVASENTDNAKFTIVYCNYQNSGHAQWGGMSGLKVDKRLVELHKEMGLDPIEQEVEVPTRRLDFLIENFFDHETIDFISIDTEGTELDVLKSFDTTKYNTKLLVIENNFKDQSISDYLIPLGWKLDKVIEQNEFYVRDI